MEKVITFYFVFPGSYQFKLAVKDKDNNEDSNFVSVTVTQDSNAAPVAQAGTDVEVILPQSVVIGDLFFVLCHEIRNGLHVNFWNLGALHHTNARQTWISFMDPILCNIIAESGALNLKIQEIVLILSFV